MAQLIIDAGATKTAFAVISEGGKLFQCTTSGINVNYTPQTDILGCFAQFVAQCPDLSQISTIEYYGAGCATLENQQKMHQILQLFFPQAHLTVDTDLMIVCLALSAGKQSIIGILGTGAATCLFDGHAITNRPPSLGYMLGDEGSGTNLGKRLLTHYMRNELPVELRELFDKQYGLTFQEIIHRIYSEPKPNQFMSSLSLFIHEHLSHPFIRQLAVGAFRDFFAIQKPYFPPSTPWQLSGSVAYHYEELVREAAMQEGCLLEQIIPNPLERLIAERIQHLQNPSK